MLMCGVAPGLWWLAALESRFWKTRCSCRASAATVGSRPICRWAPLAVRTASLSWAAAAVAAALSTGCGGAALAPERAKLRIAVIRAFIRWVPSRTCLLYTSDAADEEDSVDLGGRR